jgi:23S rRNA pseudouridine1911/1915/1917 synthase
VRKGEWLKLSQSLSRQIPEKLADRLSRSGGLAEKPGGLHVKAFPREASGIPASWGQFDVLFEDDFCLVAGKPAGMKVHPTEPGELGTLNHAVAYHYEATGQACRVRHIHRLDEDTTGPVLYAKNEWAHLVLDQAMREKRIERLYSAIVHGRLRESRGTVDQPIGKDRHHRSRRRVSATGESAVTIYELAEQYTSSAWIRLQLLTGRTHQIRVHMSFLGHPLLGDELYGGSVKGPSFSRQALHGEMLRFPHPLTGEITEVEAPWPEDLSLLKESCAKI